MADVLGHEYGDDRDIVIDWLANGEYLVRCTGCEYESKPFPTHVRAATAGRSHAESQRHRHLLRRRSVNA